MCEFTEIPLDNLFTEIPMELRVPPPAWWSLKTVTERLKVSERTIRRYIAEGKLQGKYKTVKGRRRLYIFNRSVIGMVDDRELKRQEKLAEQEEQSEDDE